MFANILAADDKHSVVKRVNLRQPIQMQLSKKQKKVDNFIFAFLNSTSNLNFLKKQLNPMANLFPQLRTSKDVVRQIYKKSCFRRPSD